MINILSVSERKFVFFQIGFRFFCFRFFCLLMNGIPIDINCPVRPCRAGVFARTTANADFFVHFRYKQIAIRYHLYCFCRTMFGTGTAVGTFGLNNAIGLDELHPSNLCKMFSLYCKGKMSLQSVQSKLQRPV